MIRLIFCILLTIQLVPNSLVVSKPLIKSTELHRSRRSVVIKAIHNIWLSRRRRDVDMEKLVLLRKRLTRMRRRLAFGPPKVVRVEIKFLTSWMDRMDDHTSLEYRMMYGNILDAIFTELIGDADYIDAKVMTLKKSNDKDPQIIGVVEFYFDQIEEDPIIHLREIIEKGRISGMEVSPIYFEIIDERKPLPPNKPSLPKVSLDVNAGPMYAPTVFSTVAPTTSVYTGPYQEYQYDIKLKRLWDPRLSDESSNTTKGLKDHIQSVIKIIFDNEPNFVDDRVLSMSDGPDEHPFVRILLTFKPGNNTPEARILQLVKSGLLGDIPIFDDYLNGQLPGSKPPIYIPPDNSQQVDLPQPTTNLAPYRLQKNVTPPAPVPTQSYITEAAPGQKLSGHVILDQTWYPFMDDPKSATDRILSHTIEKAIKDTYKPIDVDAKVTGLSRTPNNKIRADFILTFPSNVSASLKPLDDAIASGILGGLPVTSDRPADATTAPTASSRTPTPTRSYSQANQYGVVGQSGQASQDVPTQSVVKVQNLVTQAAPAQALVTQAAPTQALVTQAAPTQAVVTQAPSTQALVTQAASTQAAVTRAAPTQSIMTQAAPTQALVTQAAPTQALVTQAAPSQAAVTNAAPTQAVKTSAPPTKVVITSAAPTKAIITPAAVTHAAQTQDVAPNQAVSEAPIASSVSEVPILPAKPPVVTYQGGVVPLPQGIPSSCAEIRSCGIGNQDGEYVIKARPNCHLSIICQNMNEPNPKEYLGGPAQNQWLYWHYAVLVKLSSHDKEFIDQRACLENTAVGREFIAKVMAAGARQGNPLVPWNTNIKRMIHSYIGDAKQKTRRSLEKMDVTLSTKAVKIYKRYVLQ